MNWFKEGIGAAIAEAKTKGAIFAVVVKSEKNELLAGPGDKLHTTLCVRCCQCRARGDNPAGGGTN